MKLACANILNIFWHSQCLHIHSMMFHSRYFHGSLGPMCVCKHGQLLLNFWQWGITNKNFGSWVVHMQWLQNGCPIIHNHDLAQLIAEFCPGKHKEVKLRCSSHGCQKTSEKLKSNYRRPVLLIQSQRQGAHCPMYLAKSHHPLELSSKGLQL